MKRVFATVLGLGMISTFASADAAGRCGLFSGTADGIQKEEAVSRAQTAVHDAVSEWKASKNVHSVNVSPARAKPQPYWRSSVSSDLFVKPDVVNGSSHTVCWHGVVSPFVCTAGSRVCY